MLGFFNRGARYFRRQNFELSSVPHKHCASFLEKGLHFYGVYVTIIVHSGMGTEKI